jgi:transposase
MSPGRYTEEFRIKVAKQVTDRGHPVAEVASRLGVTSHCLYQWIGRYRVPEAGRQVADDANVESRRLKAALRRVTEERDILKKATAYFAKTSE